MDDTTISLDELRKEDRFSRKVAADAAGRDILHIVPAPPPKSEPRPGVKVTAEPPRPLMRELPPAAPFPIEALGSVLKHAAEAIQDKVQSPLAMCAQSVLAAAALAVQAHGDIELPTGQTRPLSLNLLSIAVTGERKTSGDNEAMRPVAEKEKKLAEAHAREALDYRNAKEADEAARAAAIRKAKGDKGAIKTALDKLGPEPTPPLEPMLHCDEPTYEGLVKFLAKSHPSVGVFSSDAGSFIGGHGMTDEAKARTAAGLSKLWDGADVRRVRADGSLHLRGRRVSMHLMAQPDVSAVMLSDPMLLAQGFLSRFLVSYPNSLIGTRVWREPKKESAAALDSYHKALLSILEMPAPLEPARLTLSPEARRIYIGYANHNEVGMQDGGDLEPIRGLANKLAEHAARLAGVLTLVKDINAREVAREEMASGIKLAQYYAAEALRLFDAARVNPDLLLAQEVLHWLCTHPEWKEEPNVSLPDIYRNGPSRRIRDQETARRIVRILEDHGWLVFIDGGAVIKDKPRREAWRIRRV